MLTKDDMVMFGLYTYESWTEEYKKSFPLPFFYIGESSRSPHLGRFRYTGYTGPGDVPVQELVYECMAPYYPDFEYYLDRIVEVFSSSDT